MISIRWNEATHCFASRIPNNGAGNNKAEKKANSKIDAGITRVSSGFFIVMFCLIFSLLIRVIAFVAEVQPNHWCSAAGIKLSPTQKIGVPRAAVKKAAELTEFALALE